mmetsp:Transcript_17775/g.49639  ORF Transcript_17775/g.49639 Transcript_17775/m.49639 type:complete len:93 (-) Transcript_17775:3015-3293(-)
MSFTLLEQHNCLPRAPSCFIITAQRSSLLLLLHPPQPSSSIIFMSCSPIITHSSALIIIIMNRNIKRGVLYRACIHVKHDSIQAKRAAGDRE